MWGAWLRERIALQLNRDSVRMRDHISVCGVLIQVMGLPRHVSLSLELRIWSKDGIRWALGRASASVSGHRGEISRTTWVSRDTWSAADAPDVVAIG